MTRTQTLRMIGAAVLLAGALQGCAQRDASADGKGQGAAPALQGTAWIMGEQADAAAQGQAATLHFEAGRVSGSDGCNRYSGPFTAAQGKLEFGPGRIGTQMACPTEDEAQLAQVFSRVLDETRGYRLEAGTLLLLDARGDRLALFSAQPTALAGTAWRVTGVNNGKQAVAGVITGTELTLQFMADGQLQGFGGCNRLQGSFSEDGPSLRIGRLASTRMACAEPAGRMAQEAQLRAALESAATARREGNTLELRTASGALAVSARMATPAKP